MSEAVRERVLIVGAGAVGQLIGCLMAERGHTISFLKRPGRSLSRIVARDLDHARVHALERPTTLVAGDALDAPQWILVAVRGDQIDAALAHTRQYVGAHTSIGIVPPLGDEMAVRVRKAGIEQPAFAILVGFGVWPVGDELHWFAFPGGATVLSGENDPAAFAAAQGFVALLRDAGLRAHARLVVPPPLRAAVAGEKALQMGWELAGWDIDALAADPELRALTSAAMADAIGIVMGDRTDELPALQPLDERAKATSANMRAIWRVHGPKIALQTRHLVDGLIDQGRKTGAPMDSLRALRGRLA